MSNPNPKKNYRHRQQPGQASRKSNDWRPSFAQEEKAKLERARNAVPAHLTTNRPAAEVMAEALSHKPLQPPRRFEGES